MGYYLEDRTTRIKQYRKPRREKPSGVIVLHTAENTPDWAAYDGGAEAVANFIADRNDYGSYHVLCDSDSIIRMVNPANEAFGDATDHGNWHEFHISAATRADVWPLAPQKWRDGTIHNMAVAAAEYNAWLAVHGYRAFIPGFQINRAQSQLRRPGFISHADRDPARRTDPGRTFPWTQFFAEYIKLTGPTLPEDELALFENMNEFENAVERAVKNSLSDSKVTGKGAAVDQIEARVREAAGPAATEAVDNVFKFYAADGDSPLHKIIRDVLDA